MLRIIGMMSSYHPSDMSAKRDISDLALFGGPRLFIKPISTSNLVKPNLIGFLQLFRSAFENNREQELIRRLEMELADFHHCKHVVAVCSGFWALVLSIKALALPGRNEVVMPSLTYRRLADAVAWTGLIPRFCEVDPATLAISADTAEAHLTEQTALIIGVHPIVNCCDAPGLERLASKHKIPILFDGVESVYEWVEGRKVGNFGHAECFSFHASKLINGFEGGYITTNSQVTADQFRRLCQGMDGGMQVPMPTVHAAMALQGLREIETQIQHNYNIYRTYQAILEKHDSLELLAFNEVEPTSFKNIVVKLTDDWPLERDLTIRILNAEGILGRAYYSPALHQKDMAYPAIVGPLPFTEQACQQYLLLPSGYQVQRRDVIITVKFMHWLSINSSAVTQQIEARE